jgi:hypothetical protein
MTSKLHLKQLFPSEPFSISLSSHHPATGSTAYSYASSRPAAGSPRLAPVSRTRRLPHSPRGARCICFVELQGCPQIWASPSTQVDQLCHRYSLTVLSRRPHDELTSVKRTASYDTRTLLFLAAVPDITCPYCTHLQTNWTVHKTSLDKLGTRNAPPNCK